MAAEPSFKPSFSPGRKWRIGFSVVIMTLAVFAVVAMVNYVSTQFFRRYHLSSLARIELSSRTISLLRSITNHVQVTVYCSRDEESFSDLANLLKEYTSADPRIAVRYIDYDRELGAAEQFISKYGTSTNKNVIVFECEGRWKIVLGDALVRKTLVSEQSDTPGQIAYRKKPIYFDGELLFTAAIIGVINPKPVKAYFLEGHGEHRLTEEPRGYVKFTNVLWQSYIETSPLTLLGTNMVPDDCSLLIVAGPKDTLFPIELGRIEKYLAEGGRLFALFNAGSLSHTTGLEEILTKWGVRVTTGIVKDPDNSSTAEQADVLPICGVRLPDNFKIKHPVIDPLIAQCVQLLSPREVDALDLSSQADSGVKAESILFSGPRSMLDIVSAGMAQRPSAKSLVVAVEKGAAKGVAAERGSTRILVVGDSFFLDNKYIEGVANGDFARLAVNWLVDQTMLMEGVAPKSITEYKLVVTNLELQTIQLILLAAMPGAVLLVGGLVWLRRRK